MKLASAGLLLLLAAAVMTLFIDFESVNAHTSHDKIRTHISQ